MWQGQDFPQTFLHLNTNNYWVWKKPKESRAAPSSYGFWSNPLPLWMQSSNCFLMDILHPHLRIIRRVEDGWKCPLAQWESAKSKRTKTGQASCCKDAAGRSQAGKGLIRTVSHTNCLWLNGMRQQSPALAQWPSDRPDPIICEMEIQDVELHGNRGKRPGIHSHTLHALWPELLAFFRLGSGRISQISLVSLPCFHSGTLATDPKD
jgi:hypothetical protein